MSAYYGLMQLSPKSHTFGLEGTREFFMTSPAFGWSILTSQYSKPPNSTLFLICSFFILLAIFV